MIVNPVVQSGGGAIETVTLTAGDNLTGVREPMIVSVYDGSLCVMRIQPSNSYQVVKDSVMTINAGSAMGILITPISAYEYIGLLDDSTYLGYKILAPCTVVRNDGGGN